MAARWLHSQLYTSAYLVIPSELHPTWDGVLHVFSYSVTEICFASGTPKLVLQIIRETGRDEVQAPFTLRDRAPDFCTLLMKASPVCAHPSSADLL